MSIKEIVFLLCISVGIASAVQIQKDSDIATLEDVKSADNRLNLKENHLVQGTSEVLSRTKRNLFGKKGGRVIIINRYHTRPRYSTSGEQNYHLVRPGGIYQSGELRPSGGSYQVGGGYHSSGERRPTARYESGERYERRERYQSGEIYTRPFGHLGGKYRPSVGRFSESGEFSTGSGGNRRQRVDYGDGGFAHYGDSRFNVKPSQEENDPIQTLPRPLSPLKRHSLSSQSQEDEESLETFDHIVK